MISRYDFEKICMNGNIDIVNSAIKDLKLNCTTNRIIDYWNDGLIGACSGGHLDIVELMAEHGANDWDTGLCCACIYGHLNIVKFMVENSTISVDSGLGYACCGGYLDIVNLMIEYGARNWDGGLWEACQNRHLNIVKLMIEKGASWDYMFDGYFNLFNSDLVNLIVKKKKSMKLLLKYPENKTKIFKLCELGMPIDNFRDIDGFNGFLKDMEERRNIAKHCLSGHLIRDLIGVTVEYVID